MKKFSERSKRGQRRIIVFIASVVCVLLILLVLFSDKMKTSIGELFGEGMISPAPTKVPVVTSAITMPNTPTPTVVVELDDMVEPESSEEVVRRIMEYVLNPLYPYGSIAKNGEKIESYSLEKVCGIKTYGEQVTIDKVGVGDIGIYGDFVCVCVGVDEDGNAIFAYATPYSSEMLANGGVYLGYSMEQEDALFYGMYPVPCEKYYDCFDGVADVSLVIEKASAYSNTVSIYAEPLFGMGRMFSEKMVDEIAALIPMELLLEHNVKVVPEEMKVFLDSFAVHAKADGLAGCDYCFREKKRFSLSSGHYIKAELVSLSPDNFLSCEGEWTLSLGEQTLLPFIDFKLYSYVGWGFAKAQRTEFIYDDDGTLSGYEISEVQNDNGTFVVNEDGSCVYSDSSYSIELEPGENFIDTDTCIIDLGNWEYLLVVNGSAYECDMSERSKKGEEYINNLLNIIMQNIIEGSVEETDDWEGEDG